MFSFRSPCPTDMLDVAIHFATSAHADSEKVSDAISRAYGIPLVNCSHHMQNLACGSEPQTYQRRVLSLVDDAGLPLECTISLMVVFLMTTAFCTLPSVTSSISRPQESPKTCRLSNILQMTTRHEHGVEVQFGTMVPP